MLEFASLEFDCFAIFLSAKHLPNGDQYLPSARMQDRSGIVGEAHILVDEGKIDDSHYQGEDIFALSAHKLNICDQCHRLPHRSTITDAKSNLSSDVLSLEAIRCPVKPKILYLTPDTNAIIGESVCLRVEFRADPLSKTRIVWSKKVCHYDNYWFYYRLV